MKQWIMYGDNGMTHVITIPQKLIEVDVPEGMVVEKIVNDQPVFIEIPVTLSPSEQIEQLENELLIAKGVI